MSILKLYDSFGIDTNSNKNKFFSDFRKFIKETGIDDLSEYKEIEEAIEYDETLGHYRKYSYCILSTRFVDYLTEKELFEYKTIFNDMYLKKERIPQIIKLIQNNPMKLTDLGEYFHVDPRTIRRNLDSIEDGFIDIETDTTLMVTRKKGVVSIVSTDKHKSTIHPITLNLNLTELYTLLIDVAERERMNNFSSGCYDLIMNRIYSQLSDYAKGIIDMHKDVVSYEGNHNRFYSEEELHKRFKETMFLHALKADCKVEVGFKYNNQICFEKVKVKRHEDENKCVLIADKGERFVCNKEDIIIVKEIFEN